MKGVCKILKLTFRIPLASHHYQTGFKHWIFQKYKNGWRAYYPIFALLSCCYDLWLLFPSGTETVSKISNKSDQTLRSASKFIYLVSDSRTKYKIN